MNIDFIYRFFETLGYTHPLHPPFTHLTIGLVMGALIFYLIAMLPRCGRFAQTAGHCSALAFLVIFPTVILGVMDWYHYYGAGWIFPIKMKIILAGILALFLLLSVILYTGRQGRSGPLLLIYLFSFFTVVGLGYFGGEIVFANKFNKANGKPPAAEKTTHPGSKSEDASFADVQTIFRNKCINCHTGTNPPKGLDLTSYQEVLKGSNHDPVVIPGKPMESELIRRVKGLSTPQMPLAGPALPDSDIRTLEKWIKTGAPGPES